MPAQKRLKTVEASQTEDDVQADEEKLEQKSEKYQHIKEAKGKTEQILDTATKEQAEIQQNELANIEEDKEAEASENLPERDDDKDVEMSEVAQQKPEKLDVKDKKQDNPGSQHPEGLRRIFTNRKFLFILTF